jgi:tryptophan halogenase
MLLGLGGSPTRARPALALLDPVAARAEFAEVQDGARRLVAALPECGDYLDSIMGTAARTPTVVGPFPPGLSRPES